MAKKLISMAKGGKVTYTYKIYQYFVKICSIFCYKYKVKINKCFKLWSIMVFIWCVSVEDQIDFCKYEMTVCTMVAHI